jgi:hypothetical protein
MNLKKMFFTIAVFVCSTGSVFLSAHSVQSSALQADDLAIALSEKPEYGELFDLFVAIQVALAEQEPVKVLRPKVYALIKRIEFVQKYTQDPLLSDVLTWCYAQKGCGKRRLAVWHKALIAFAAVAVLTAASGGMAAYISRRQRVAQAEGARQQQLQRRSAVVGGGVHGEGTVGTGDLNNYNRHNPLSLEDCDFTDQMGSFNSTTCPICLSDFTPGEACYMDTRKTHAFHQNCLHQSFQGGRPVQCPICRNSGYSHYLRFVYPAPKAMTYETEETRRVPQHGMPDSAEFPISSQGAGSAVPGQPYVERQEGQLSHIRLGKGFKITRQALDHWGLSNYPVAHSLLKVPNMEEVLYIDSGEMAYRLPSGIVEGTVANYQVVNERASGEFTDYTKIAQFQKLDGDIVYICRNTT